MGSIQNELNDFLLKPTGNHVSANECDSGTNYLLYPRYHCISLSPPPNTNGQSCCGMSPCRRPYKRLSYEIWVRKSSYTRTDGSTVRYNTRTAVHWQSVCVYSTTNTTKSEERCIFLPRTQTLTFAQFFNRGLQQPAHRVILYGPLTERVPVTECSLTQRQGFVYHLKFFRHGQGSKKLCQIVHGDVQHNVTKN